jgi:hypothetical protein
MSIPNPKCATCKCYWKPDDTDIKSSGLLFKCCKKCRNYAVEYFDKNKEKINENIMCGCGNTYYKRFKARHEKGEPHRKWLLKTEEMIE